MTGESYRSLRSAGNQPFVSLQRGEVQRIDADLAGHQLVQQGLEQFFQYRALLAVQLDQPILAPPQPDSW